MAAALRDHLIDSYYTETRTFNQNRGPFNQPAQSSTQGAISYQMHGAQPSFSLDSQPSFIDISEATAAKIAQLQLKLNQKLGPEFISQRPGPGGGSKLTYAEGWKIINLANDVFGFNGWSSSVVSLTTDFIDFHEELKKYNVGVTAIIRVTLRDGVFHEDIGYGMVENMKSKGASLDKCKKEAVTDGLKRALRNFGNLLGNCLYDKSYTQEVVKIKVAPPKFDKNELHRRPEFAEPPECKPNVASTSNASTSHSHTSSNTFSNATTSSSVKRLAHTSPSGPGNIKSDPQKPLSSLPAHMRSEIATSTPNAKGKSPAHHTPTINSGLTTPLTTPLNVQTRPIAQAPPPQQLAAALQPQNIQDPEESFSFNSDDDALFAAVDLGEGDLGRPIDFEEGIGGTALSEGSEVSGEGQQSSTTAVEQQPQQRQRTNNTTASNSVPQQQQSRPMHNQNQTRAPQSNPIRKTGHAPSSISNGPQQQRVSAPGHVPAAQSNQKQMNYSINTATNTVSSTSTTLPYQQRTSVSGHTPASRSYQNQNHNPTSTSDTTNITTSSAANVNVKKPSPPSMGGFQFPQGMNPLSAPVGPPPVARSVAGMKRSADTMQSASSVQRRHATGMGLMQQGGNGGTGQRREVLGRLEVGEGGDVKRLKK